MPQHLRLSALCFSLMITMDLIGCGVGTPAPASVGDAVTLHGVVHGGQAPVDGAVMQLYAVGTGGNGTGAQPLITSRVVKSVSGAFTITGDYTCPPLVGGISPPVYLTATGGNPGLTPAVNNTALALVVALGPCNTLYANAATTTININEVTTAAAAWALAPFANLSTSYSSIASSGTNLAGITNAMLTAQQLADPATGASPGSSAPVGSIMESAKLNTLADILASCVNSTGADTNCSGLFTDVKPVAAAKPSDTFGAALSIVKNPANNVSSIYRNHVGTSPPFPALSSAPNDWTMSITYSLSTGPFTNFSLAAFDAQGNFWGFYNDTSATIGNLTEINRQYTPVVSVPLEPYTDGNYYTATGLAIDGSQHIWITSEENSNANGTVVNYKGSVLEFDASGNLLSGTPGYTSGILNPRAIAADSNGSIWVGSNGVTDNSAGAVMRAGGDVSLFNSTGNALFPSGGFANFSDFDPGPIVFDSNHTAWCANDILDDSANGSNVGQYLVSITAPTTTNPTPTVTRIYFPNAYSSTIGVDTNNNVWFTSGANQITSGFNQLGVVNASGTLVTSSLAGGGLINATGMVIDPANNIWIANANESQQGPASNNFANAVTISQFSTAPASFGAALSPAQGYGTDPNLSSGYLTGLLIDSSGSLWVNAGPTETYQGLTYTLGGLTTFVGLATPLKTPALGPPQAP